MQEPKYLVQVLERTEHFCKTFKLITLKHLDEWLLETRAMIAACEDRHPTHSYVYYISNNPVDLAKGEHRLLVQEATKILKGETNKVGVTTSTKAFYLGMGREITSFDFDNKNDPVKLRKDLFQCLSVNLLKGSCTETPNGLHVHLAAKDRAKFLNTLYPHLHTFIDKQGHDLCSPIAGTYKDGFLITKTYI